WQMRKPSPDAQKSSDTDLDFALAITLMPLLSPVSWDHYVVLLLLPLAVLAARIRTHGSRSGWRAFVGLFLVLSIPQTTFDWLLALSTDAGLHGYGIWLLLPLRTVCLAILAGWIFWEMREASRGDAERTQSVSTT